MYKTESIELNDAPRLSITLDAYPEHPFVLGGAEFLEKDGGLELSYNYEAIAGFPREKHAYERAIGDFIVYYVANPDPEHPIIYTGGT